MKILKTEVEHGARKTGKHWSSLCYSKRRGECFRIDNGVRKGVSCFLGFSMFMIIIGGVPRSRQQSRFQCLYGCSDERDGEEGRE